jgi:arabinoxylan arabinofuranohydrolase
MKETLVRTIGSKMLSKQKVFIITIVCMTAFLVWADYPIMSQHYAADPTAIEWDGRIYVYCSNDEENGEGSGYIMDSIACFSTDDLKNWTDHGVVFDADELSSWYSGTAWAPCIVSNNGQLYLYFGDAYWGIGVVTSTSPTGPFTAPKNDLVVKRESISGGTPGADSEWLFDPGVFVDDDGTVHLYFGGGGANQARYIELDTNMYDAIGSAVVIEFPDFFEASHMHKYNGTYYYSYADNYDSDYTDPPPTPSSQIAYMTGTDPAGPFTYQGVALDQPPNNYGNNNHHTFFTYQGQGYCVYHNRYQAGIDGVSTTEHRNICLDRMYYNPDGTIQPVVHTQDGLPQLKNLDPFVRVEGETIAQQSGIKTEVCSQGGMNVTSIDDGDWICVRGVDFLTGTNSFEASVASAGSGGSIELRLESLDGTLVGTCNIPNTGGAQTWITAVCSVSGASGVHDLYLRFTGSGDDLFNLDWWQFQTDSLTFATVNVDSSTIYQTIEGLGGALCFYNGWVTAHPYKQEIYDYAFSGLNLSMLRLANWWRGTDGQDTDAYEFVSAANQRLDYSVPILMSSWSPPAYLKSNGEVGNGGTLIQIEGEYDYAGFADYWYDSLQDYIAHGVNPTWIGIQNEPDWTADYDSCRFDPYEDQYAGFALAQDAVYQKLQSMTSPPKLLGPECVGLYGNAAGLQNYMAQMNPDTFYGIAHHLYGGSTDGTPDGYNPAFTTVLNASNTLFPGKPRFMTEYGDIKGLIPCANLIHNSLVVEQVSGYNHWCLIWPEPEDPEEEGIGLVEIEFPWGSGEWDTPKGYRLNPSYWSMKHYSYFIEQGFKRINAASGNSDVLASAYISPEHDRLVAVLINRSTTESVYVTLNAGSFAYDASYVYQTSGDDHFVSQGPIVGSQLTLPVSSLTTVVLDNSGPVAPTGLSATAILDSQVSLIWTAAPGATSYNVKRSNTSGGPYTTIAPNITIESFTDTSVTSGQTYYYVVSSNTLTGESSNSNEVIPSDVHTYLKFDETGGTTASDFTGNGWTGTLVNGPIWTTGKFGNAVDLDGANDYVSLPTGVVDGLTDFTIATWVYLDTIDNWSRIFDFGTGTSVNMFLTPRNSVTGAVRFAITTSGAGGEQQITGSAALPSGVWTHVAVTRGAGTGILYVNGSEVGRSNSMSLTPDSLGATTQNYIGRSQYSADACLNGRVDDFRIYADALSAAEAALLYAEHVPAAIPSTPTGLSATAMSGSRIDLTWNASAEATNYNIKRSAAGGGPYTLVTSVSETSCSDMGLPEMTPYYYVVSAVNSAGESIDSTEADATTQSVPPAVPSGLTAMAGDGSVALNWTANTEGDLAGYNVYRSTTSGSGYTLLNGSLLNSPEFTDINVSYYITYFYVITAVDEDTLESAYSDEVEVMPIDSRAVQLNTADFESGLGNWVNITGEDTDEWTRDSGGTLTPSTGPDSGAGGSAWYVYLETSPSGAGGAGDTAILESPVIEGFEYILTFYYHMYGIDIGTLNVDVYDGTWHNAVWSLSGQQHSSDSEEYTQALVDLRGYTGPIQIRFRAVAAGGPRGDIAIDDIMVLGRILYGDMDGDYNVSAGDLSAFIGYWLQENCDLDLDGDCIITLYEFSEFAGNWLNDPL